MVNQHTILLNVKIVKFPEVIFYDKELENKQSLDKWNMDCCLSHIKVNCDSSFLMDIKKNTLTNLITTYQMPETVLLFSIKMSHLARQLKLGMILGL